MTEVKMNPSMPSPSYGGSGKTADASAGLGFALLLRDGGGGEGAGLQSGKAGTDGQPLRNGLREGRRPGSVSDTGNGKPRRTGKAERGSAAEPEDASAETLRGQSVQELERMSVLLSVQTQEAVAEDLPEGEEAETFVEAVSSQEADLQPDRPVVSNRDGRDGQGVEVAGGGVRVRPEAGESFARVFQTDVAGGDPGVLSSLASEGIGGSASDGAGEAQEDPGIGRDGRPGFPVSGVPGDMPQGAAVQGNPEASASQAADLVREDIGSESQTAGEADAVQQAGFSGAEEIAEAQGSRQEDPGFASLAQRGVQEAGTPERSMRGIPGDIPHQRVEEVPGAGFERVQGLSEVDSVPQTVAQDGLSESSVLDRHFSAALEGAAAFASVRESSAQEEAETLSQSGASFVEGAGGGAGSSLGLEEAEENGEGTGGTETSQTGSTEQSGGEVEGAERHESSGRILRRRGILQEDRIARSAHPGELAVERTSVRDRHPMEQQSGDQVPEAVSTEGEAQGEQRVLQERPGRDTSRRASDAGQEGVSQSGGTDTLASLMARQGVPLDGRVGTFRELQSGTDGSGILQTTEASLPEDLANVAASRMGSQNQSLVIELEPKSLGQITLKLSYDSGRASLSILASNPKTLALLSTHAGEMARILEQKTGDQTVVLVPEQEAGQQEQALQDQQGGWSENRQEAERRWAGQNEERRQRSNSESFLQQMRLGLVEL